MSDSDYNAVGIIKMYICLAMQEMMEDSRQEGSTAQITEIIDSIMKELHCPLERARKIGGKPQAEYHQARSICKKA